MEKKYAKEPKIKWKSKIFDESDESIFSPLHLKNKEKRRERAKIETARDFKKPIEQLVCDVHDEILNKTREPEENIAGAQQRMVTMMAKIAKSNNRTNILLLIFAIAMVIITLLTYCKLK